MIDLHVSEVSDLSMFINCLSLFMAIMLLLIEFGTKLSLIIQNFSVRLELVNLEKI